MIAYLALSGGFFTFCSILLAFHEYGERIDTVQRRLDSVSNVDQKTYIVDEELSKPLMERLIKPMLKNLSEKLLRNQKTEEGRFSPSGRSQYEKLKKQVYQAGLNIGVNEYQVIRMIVMLGAAVMTAVISMLITRNLIKALAEAAVALYAGYVGLRFHLASRVGNRKKDMEKQLPEVLDLLSISVEAGLGFEQAILQVIEHFEGPLIDELTITYREMSMGRNRKDALTIFSERCDLEEIKSFVGAIVQAGELGISIKNVLRAQSAAMRQSRRNKVEEKAQKISVKILIPMVLFIFPVIFIVLMGPALIKILEQLG
jgi:tight adherence protein C